MTEKLEWQWIDPPHCCRGGGMSATDERQKRGELRECPFCGEPGVSRSRPVSATSDLPIYWAECSICESGTTFRESEADAVAAWNRRSEPELPAEVVRVVAAARTAHGSLGAYRAYADAPTMTRANGRLAERELHTALAAYDRWLAGRSEDDG